MMGLTTPAGKVTPTPAEQPPRGPSPTAPPVARLPAEQPRGGRRHGLRAVRRGRPRSRTRRGRAGDQGRAAGAGAPGPRSLPAHVVPPSNDTHMPVPRKSSPEPVALAGAQVEEVGLLPPAVDEGKGAAGERVGLLPDACRVDVLPVHGRLPGAAAVGAAPDAAVGRGGVDPQAVGRHRDVLDPAADHRLGGGLAAADGQRADRDPVGGRRRRRRQAGGLLAEPAAVLGQLLLPLERHRVGVVRSGRWAGARRPGARR